MQKIIKVIAGWTGHFIDSCPASSIHEQTFNQILHAQPVSFLKQADYLTQGEALESLEATKLKKWPPGCGINIKMD